MRILLLLLAAAATLCAQLPTSNGSVPGWQSIVNSMLSQNSGANTSASPSGVVSPWGGTYGTGNLKPPAVLIAALQTLTRERNSGAQAGASPASPCSVPLLHAQIPSDVNFTMRMVEPPTNKVDRMEVAVPAPACPESPR